MTEPTMSYNPPRRSITTLAEAQQSMAEGHDPRGCTLCLTDRTREAVAAWEQWTEARSFVEHTAAVVRLDAAMLALRAVAT